MPVITTETLEPFTHEDLPGSLPGRPVDPGSLSGLLGWAATQMWPLARPSVLHRTAPLYTETWADRHSFEFHAGSPPPGSGLYQWLLSAYLLGQLAQAGVTGFVEPDSDDAGGYSQGIVEPLPLYLDGQTVRLESWEYLYRITDGTYYGPYMPDGSDLWRWSAALKGSGPASEKAVERYLPGALRTAQAMYDALAVALPQAEPPKPPPAPTPRRKSWR